METGWRVQGVALPTFRQSLAIKLVASRFCPKPYYSRGASRWLGVCGGPVLLVAVIIALPLPRCAAWYLIPDVKGS